MMGKRSFADLLDEHIKSEKTVLPPFNKTALRVRREVVKEEPDTRVIEELISRDQSLASQVLRTANSAFCGGLVKVITVHDAVVRLGVKEVSNIVILVTQRNHFRSKDPFVNEIMERLWQHSVQCAIGAQWLARYCGFQSLADQAFIAGLLHDVGKLFLLMVIEDICSSGKMTSRPSHAMVNEIMNSLHAEQGYFLLKNWNLPETYCVIARDHHTEEFDSKDHLLAVIRLVNKACHKMGIGLKTDTDIVLAASPEAELLNLSEVSLAELEITLEDSLALAP
ncbi:MAG: HDOD domain-containing protein [Thermodesulfobacteriota bacterium]|nr:HDOD domain-containing protein [Thermodesulfobacteriota bacterium]